jgi:hypothetical protein
MQRNCFIVTSTLYSSNTCYSVESRFNQTMDTIRSIKEKDPNCYILFIDNSHVDVGSFLDGIRKNVDSVIVYEHNLASLYYNITTNKSLGELLLMYKALEELNKTSIAFDRIFKISGRYTLNESFCIDDYKNAPRKIVGALRKWMIYKDGNESERISFETALWSFPYEELNNIQNALLINSYDFIVKNDTNIENAFFNCIPQEILGIKNPIGITANYSKDGEMSKF